MSLQVNNVVSGYGKNIVLNGVSMKAEKSKVTCVLGPNGAGKSTLLKTIFGFLAPSQGKIIFDEEDITGIRTHKALAKGICYLLQGRSVFPSMTVLENLEIGAYTRKDREQIKIDIEEVFDRFPVLKKKKNQASGSLSGGEQRMLEIGRTYMLHPKLVLVDEVSIGLAPKFAEEAYENIADMAREGIAVVIVEQNVHDALTISDYGYVLNLGQVVFEGNAKDLLMSGKVVAAYLPRVE